MPILWVQVFVAQILIFGYLINQNSILVSPVKIEATVQWEVPRSPSEILSFLRVGQLLSEGLSFPFYALWKSMILCISWVGLGLQLLWTTFGGNSNHKWDRTGIIRGSWIDFASQFRRIYSLGMWGYWFIIIVE